MLLLVDSHPVAAALVLWGPWAAAGVQLDVAQVLALPGAVHLGPEAVVVVQLGPCVATVVQLAVAGILVHPGAGTAVQLGPGATSHDWCHFGVQIGQLGSQ